MRHIWRRLFPRAEPPPVYVGSHEDKLRRIPRLHVDPDDEGHTREDKAREQADREADRFPLH